jgi:hypothetical protein
MTRRPHLKHKRPQGYDSFAAAVDPLLAAALPS